MDDGQMNHDRISNNRINNDQKTADEMYHEQMADDRKNPAGQKFEDHKHHAQKNDGQKHDAPMHHDPMNDDQLQAWVERISLEYFGRPFLHRARFNNRLRACGGRYALRTHHIDISRKHYELYGAEETEMIIKHELCHYHLHLQGKGYRHRDADFKQLLRQVGGTRYCKALPERRTQPYRYRLLCTGCGQTFLRKRRIDTKKYVCGRCRGKLQIFKLDSPGIS